MRLHTLVSPVIRCAQLKDRVKDVCCACDRVAHVERMDEYRMARKVLMGKVSGGWVRGGPRLGCMDGVKVAMGNRGMTVEAARPLRKAAPQRSQRVESPDTYVCN